jgi:hypothetical protein
MPFVNFATAARLLLVVPALLAGCSADRYFLVEKQDLSRLGAALVQQQADLAVLRSETGSQHSALMQALDQATQRMIDTLETRVEPPVCPPPPPMQPAPIPVCPAVAAPSYATGAVLTEEEEGYAEHLKGKLIVGEVERFFLANPGLVYSARIDSGAETSSIDARNITRFERDGTKWVRFDIPAPDGSGMITLEREISRRVRVMQSNTEEAERRVVVELQFQIGDYRQEAEFTLTNREHLSHSVLIGRNILRDVMLIDVGREHATELPPSLFQAPLEGTE